MKRIYVLYNMDTNEVIYASEDYDLLCEVMCDIFIDDVEYQWYWDSQWSIFETEDLGERAKMVWEDMLEWYNDYVIIKEVEVI